MAAAAGPSEARGGLAGSKAMKAMLAAWMTQYADADKRRTVL
jgi:hypothetical protein